MDDKRKRALVALAALIVLRRQRRRRKQSHLKTRNGRSWVKPHIREHDQLGVAEHVIKATRCDSLLATTNVEFARTLHNKRLTDSIFESARRLLSWSGQQHTNVLASLRPAYIRQLLGVSINMQLTAQFASQVDWHFVITHIQDAVN